MTYGIPGKTRFGENPTTHSKATRSQGKGIKAPRLQHPLDTAEGGTSKITRHIEPVSKLPLEERGYQGPIRAEVSGHAPDGSGKYLEPTFDRDRIGVPKPIVTQLPAPGTLNGDGIGSGRFKP